MRSERQFCGQLDDNLLFRWFLAMDMIEESLVPRVFTKNGEELQESESERRRLPSWPDTNESSRVVLPRDEGEAGGRDERVRANRESDVTNLTHGFLVVKRYDALYRAFAQRRSSTTPSMRCRCLAQTRSG